MRSHHTAIRHVCVCSVLVDVDASILSRVMVSPGFLLPAVTSYTALMKLFLLGHTADVKADAPQQVSLTHTRLHFMRLPRHHH